MKSPRVGKYVCERTSLLNKWLIQQSISVSSAQTMVIITPYNGFSCVNGLRELVFFCTCSSADGHQMEVEEGVAKKKHTHTHIPVFRTLIKRMTNARSRWYMFAQPCTYTPSVRCWHRAFVRATHHVRSVATEAHQRKEVWWQMGFNGVAKMRKWTTGRERTGQTKREENRKLHKESEKERKKKIKRER